MATIGNESGSQTANRRRGEEEALEGTDRAVAGTEEGRGGWGGVQQAAGGSRGPRAGCLTLGTWSSRSSGGSGRFHCAE